MKPSVYIGSAIWRSVEPLHMKALVPFLRDSSYGYFPHVGDAMIERARGISATHFLRHTKGEVHLSLDSDICEFGKEAIDLMCEQAVEFGIVGACYITRSTMRTFPTSHFEEGVKVIFANDPTPVPVQWVATGCVAVHRRVFEEMVEKRNMPLLHEPDGERAFYDFYETMQYQDPNAGWIKLSEDYAFSEYANQIGIKSYINPAIRVMHLGPYPHRLEDMAQEILAPQALAITRVDRQWRIECEGTKMTAQEQGRISQGEMAEANAVINRAERRRQKNGKTVHDLIGAGKEK